ncbi:MAG TPA: helix-turn-helix domain-containing protein [Acidimicrobiia bacterium]|nr:helix-turn-helix domain-containing protein [Acidimicrobiia bacterium]
MDREVFVLRWPEEVDAVERLRHLGIPRLLLVEPGVAPPNGTSCVEDWVRLPADDVDLRVRLAALAERAARHPPAPIVEDHGCLSHRGVTVILPPVDERVARALVEHFGLPVTVEELRARAWPDGGSNTALRVHISRLRRRLEPLGLAITSVRGRGYLIRDPETVDAMSATAV